MNWLLALYIKFNLIHKKAWMPFQCLVASFRHSNDLELYPLDARNFMVVSQVGLGLGSTGTPKVPEAPDSLTVEVVKTHKALAALGAYSQAIKANNTVFVSGVLGLIPDTGKFVSENVKEQTEQVMKNMGESKWHYPLANMKDFKKGSSLGFSLLERLLDEEDDATSGLTPMKADLDPYETGQTEGMSGMISGKNVGVPECEGAATTKSPWNAPDGKKGSKKEIDNNSVTKLHKQMSQLTAESPADSGNKTSLKG
ncbi:reactive intermediate deaminase A, chloroplastic-like protein [Tanacetum coccineum]